VKPFRARFQKPASSSSAPTRRHRGDGRQDRSKKAAAKAKVSTVPGHLGVIEDENTL
jgi:acetyl/propionyl-CoA carboxylase alpha subunit